MLSSMIISASYKTDIPTFYGTWFMNRLRAGYCKMINPHNRTAYRVSLDPADVAGVVFWTKNLGPFLRYLPEVRARLPFIVQYTINGYPRALEYAVVDAKRSVDHVRRVNEEFGQRACVWRYDTIVVSTETPIDFHLRNFESLAAALQGVVDEVVISFVQLYRKTLRNMNWAASEFGFSWQDPSDDEKRRLTADLVAVAASHGMRLSICSQRNLIVPGASDARCVDADRLGDVAGHRIGVALRGNRKECGCFASRDIGEYDTCPHGCVYCYAVQNRELAQRRYREHRPDSEFLFEPTGDVAEAPTQPSAGTTLPLFDQGWQQETTDASE